MKYHYPMVATWTRRPENMVKYVVRGRGYIRPAQWTMYRWQTPAQYLARH